MKWFNQALLSTYALLSVVQGANIAETLIDRGFDTLVDLALKADLGAALSDDQSTLTVLAPTDDAFASVTIGDDEIPVADFLGFDNDYTKGLLTSVLTYHVLDQELTSDVIDGTQTSLLPGEPVNVNTADLTVNGVVSINDVDIQADGGVIHSLNGVLVPPGAPLTPIFALAQAAGLTSLEAAVEAVGYSSLLNSPGVYTVFAPSDAAFAAFLDEYDATLDLFANDDKLLKYLKRIINSHVVPNDALLLADVISRNNVKTLRGKVPVSKIKPSTTDQLAINGVVHIIDEVILNRACTRGLSNAIRLAKENAEDEVATGPSTIAEIADSDASLSTLVSAAKQAGLVPTLDDENQALTVFAPDNTAFKDIEDTLPFLLANNKYAIGLLTDVLTYHVVPGIQKAENLAPLSTIGTLNGADLPLDINLDGDSFVNNDSPVIATDVEASNGVVHVISKVMLPSTFPDGTITGIAVADTTTFSTLTTILGALGLADTFDTTKIHTVFAPTNEAFGKLLTALNTTPETLLGDNKLKELLKKVVQLHYVPKRALDSGAVVALGNKRLKTAGGKIRPADVVLPNLVTPDVKALNGIVHVIDEVIVSPKLAKAIVKRLGQLSA